MLVYIQAKDQHAVILEDVPQKFMGLMIHKQNNELIINDQQLSLFHEQTYLFCYDQIKYQLYTSMYDDNYHTYQKYQCSKRYITIGNKLDHDICLQDQNFKTIYIFDLHNNNYEIGGKKAKFVDGQLFEFINLRFSFHHDFVMINQVGNVYVNLQPYEDDHKYQRPCFINKDHVTKFKAYNELPKFKLTLDKPNTKPIFEPMPLIIAILPSLLMGCASLINGILMTYNALLNQRTIIEIIPMLIMPMTMLVSSLLVLPLQRKYEQKKYAQKLEERKRTFIAMLQQQKANVDNTKKVYDKILHERYATFMLLYQKVMNRDNLLWSKKIDQEDYLWVLLGEAHYELDITINDLDIASDDELFPSYQEFLHDSKMIESYYCLNLKKYREIAVIDEDDFVDYLLLQLTTYFHPDDLQICIICSSEDLKKRNYLRFIPHLSYGDLRLLINYPKHMSYLNELPLTDEVLYINFIPSLTLKKQRVLNIYEHITQINDDNQVILTKDKIIFKDFSYQTYIYRHFAANMEQLYLMLNNLYYQQRKYIRMFTLFDMLKITNIDELKILENWNYNHTYQGISGCLGRNENNECIELDLLAGKHGPHGLIAGSTGSGKSELITSYLMGLCTKYHPSQLQLMIIDFKGGGLIQAFANKSYHLPHLIQTVTNLNKTEIKRCLVALENECIRRQKLFKALADQLSMPSMDIDKYQQFHDDASLLPALAHLIIVVDEFAELKQTQHHFIYQLISIARIGRSLGIHLILSTQKPRGIIDEQIYANMHFTICLKVQNKEDSMEVIGSDEASKLKSAGDFILKCDEQMYKGKSGYGMVAKDYLYNKNRIQLLDEMKNITIEKNFSKQTIPTQIAAVANKICALAPYDKTSALFLEPISAIDCLQIPYDNHKGIIIGIKDDFYHNQQTCYLHTNQPLIAFIHQLKDQQAFLLTYLYNVLKASLNEIKEGYIFDDGLLLDEDIKQQLWLEMVDTLEQKENFFRFNCHDQQRKLIIFSNIQKFWTSYESLQPYLIDLLMNHESYKATILIIAYNTSAISARCLNLINERISIGIKDKNELINIFNSNEASELDIEQSYGFCKDEHILPFIEILTNKQALLDLIAKQCQPKQSKIKVMPQKILANMQKSKLFIGISYSSYDNIHIDSFPLLVISKQPACIAKFIMICHQQGIKISKDLTEPSNVYIMAYKDYLKMIDEHYYEYRLWIGPGFKDQYLFNYHVKKDLVHDEGYLEYQGQIERVKLYGQ
ncbi:MAG: FtsK/SpoIIIE domain-containing protein [Erysipelotrichaceae bacterium]|nr:FtsK/SpoIIIE domain-containing protein [Erysipelotrichaceae bacterium]